MKIIDWTICDFKKPQVNSTCFGFIPCKLSRKKNFIFCQSELFTNIRRFDAIRRSKTIFLQIICPCWRILKPTLFNLLPEYAKKLSKTITSFKAYNAKGRVQACLPTKEQMELLFCVQGNFNVFLLKHPTGGFSFKISNFKNYFRN